MDSTGLVLVLILVVMLGPVIVKDVFVTARDIWQWYRTRKDPKPDRPHFDSPEEQRAYYSRKLREEYPHIFPEENQ